MTVSAEATYLEAVSAALRDELESDSRVVLLGEDIGVLGGAFRVTAGLLDAFGFQPVIDTPIAETAVADPNPVRFFEHKGLYRSLRGELLRRRPPERLGRAAVRMSGEALTLVTY